MTYKPISHLKNVNQVAGKFVFLKPEEELHVWYGLAVSVWQIELETALLVSVCELPELSMAQATTITYRNFELLSIHCKSIMM